VSETIPPQSSWQHYAAEVVTWSTSVVQAVVPECPVLRNVATCILRAQAAVLKGSLWLVEVVLAKLEPPEAPRSEKITIE
jgi:hypothetical protein